MENKEIINLEFPKVSQEQWKQLVQVELDGGNFNESLVWQSLEGLNVKPYFSQEDIDYNTLDYLHTSPAYIISRYNPLFVKDADGFIITQESGQENLEDKLLFLNDEFLQPSPKSKNYLAFDLFSKAESLADYTINTNKGKEIITAKNYIKSLLADTSLHQNAGASIIQQLGIALAKANEYVNLLGKASLEKIYFRFSIGYNYFFEIAKLRAFRKLWEAFTRQYQVSPEPFIFCESSMRNKSVLDCENNLVRTALEGTAAFIGNADAIFLHDYTEWGKDNSLIQEMAYKQLLILKEESMLTKISDGLHGAYYIEYLTEYLVQNAWKNFQEIEREEGYAAALQKGFIQKRIIAQAKKEQEAFNSGKLSLIGVNKFRDNKENKKPKTTEYSPKIIKSIRLAESLE